jgi:hypothetical protein
MGSSLSMDVSAAAADIATLVTRESEKADDTQFEDALRQEVLLVPEDMEDIHIQASPATTAVTEATDTATDTDAADANADTPANNTRNGNAAAAAAAGKGRHWKRNLKKKQQIEQQATERTQEQRREQIRPIIDKLTELQMNVSYPAIRELYKVLNQFVKTGEDTKFKIPFPEFSRKIKGELSNAPYIPCWVKLEMD